MDMRVEHDHRLTAAVELLVRRRLVHDFHDIPESGNILFVASISRLQPRLVSTAGRANLANALLARLAPVSSRLRLNERVGCVGRGLRRKLPLAPHHMCL